jgi:hypothetical protein
VIFLLQAIRTAGEGRFERINFSRIDIQQILLIYYHAQTIGRQLLPKTNNGKKAKKENNNTQLHRK